MIYTPPVDVTVTYNGTLLSPGIDYTISYDSSMGTGIGTATVSGIGRFTGENTVYYATETNTLETVSVETDYTYTTDRITIGWDMVEDATGYRILRYNEVSQEWDIISEIPFAAVLNYCDSNLTAGTAYSYKVVAYAKNNIDDSTAFSHPSSVITASTAPTKVTIYSKYTCTDSAIKINWNKSIGATGYKIFRYNDSTDDWDVIKYIYDADTLSYRDSGLTQGKLYSYKIQAFKDFSGNETVLSEESAVFNASTKPARVTLLSDCTQTENTVCISWDEVSGADGYRIYRYASDKPKLIGKTDSNTLSYNDENLSSGCTYKYCVKAYKTLDGELKLGEASDEKEITTLPEALEITAADITSDAAEITWGEVNCIGYEIWQLENDDYVKVSTVEKDVNTYSASNPDLSLEYRFKIRAYTEDSSGEAVYGSFTYAAIGVEKVLSTTTISQISGEITGYSACGPTVAAILVNAQKGESWNKDDLILYSEEHELNDQGSLRSGGGMTAPRVIDLISGYSNGSYTAKNIYDSSLDMTAVLKEQIDAGNRAIICVRYSSCISTNWYAATHFVVISGYTYVKGSLYFYYSDPYYTGDYDRGLLLESADVIETSMYRVCTKEPCTCIVLD